MEVTKLITTKMAHRRFENRKLKTIQEYTTVSDSLAPKFTQRINETIDSIARYAKRKDCHLEFVPAEDLYENSMQVNVYKKGLPILKDDDGLPFMEFDFEKLSGQSVLPKDTKGTDLVSYIRKVVKNIIANDKN